MEVTQPRQRMNLRLCQTFNCTANASSTCLTDEVVVCNMCTAIFHYDCNVKIKDGEGFVYHTLETLKSFVEIMKDRGMRTRIDKIKKDFREEISYIQHDIKALEDEIAAKQICSSNLDYFVQKTRELAKSIIESNIYSVYTDYIAKLKICEIVPNKLDDSGEMGLYGIRTQFYLDAKKKEMEFKENKLKALAQEMDTRVTHAKQQSDQKFAAVESRITQEAQLAKSSIEELKQLMLGMFEEIRKEQRLKFEEFSSILKVQEEEANKSHTLNEELKSNLKDHKQKIDSIEKKQEQMEKDIEVTNKSTKEIQTKQDEKADELKKKIEDLTKDSSNSIVKMESSIEDISQKIKSTKEDLKKEVDSSNEVLKKEIKASSEDIKKETKSSNEALKKEIDSTKEDLKKEIKSSSEDFKKEINSSNDVLNKEIDRTKEDLKKEIKTSSEDLNKEIKTSNEVLKKDFESKIGAAESSLQKDQKKKQEDYSKMIEGYSEEFKSKYSELIQTVDTIQENLTPVTEFVNWGIENRKIAKEKILKQLSPKGDQFYIDKLKLDSDKAKTFKDGFTQASGVYKRLGQFDYGQSSCTTYYVYACIQKDNWWIYIGEVKEGTHDTPHGIGIRVWYNGSIDEGYWKDGKLHGRGRCIYNNGGSYYIGEWKEDKRNGEGTYYYNNGDIEYEGGWKDNSYYGQGTRYRDGHKYTGIWDGNYKGQGEVNYEDGKKYKGQWEGGCFVKGYRRHGLGTLYSADGQVLNQGKWEKNEYKGKE